ncbi:MAG: NfeD family protein [Alphaproteobacteria bacterium]|nr:NfeD family protein [Alphaproteobacteria bacterium]
MELSALPPYILWLAFGVACLLAEMLIATGIGFLFAGLGALTAGSIVTAMPELDGVQQGVIFFATTALWTAFLWKPLKKFQRKSSGKGYRNMVGDTAFVGVSGLKKGTTGEATWSGTIMRAELAEGLDALPPGAQAQIVNVVGNTLILKPKP